MADYHFVYKDVEGASTQDDESKPKDKAWIDEKTEEELEDLEDDLDDDRFLEDYRKKRLAEMREAVKIAKFGSVIPISGSDFVREVSQAPQVFGGCCYKIWLNYPATKFVKIISTECIPNYPDRNLPTILVYNSSAVKATYVGIHSFGRRCTPESVALVLCQSDPVLNDGHGGEQSTEAVLKGVRKNFVERVIREHEDDDDGSSSD
ncbi:UNVERIFIED_CONTAM: Viral IAP-associated factor [Sesamum latifolium]|uniref:Viral IAP-associated factor n=1 Tax=Sesamum latifolium TaxID=2727402 RepID=A0AAW2X9I3_9LAMI